MSRKKNEMEFVYARTKNEKFVLGLKNQLIREAVDILYVALQETKSEILKEYRLQLIIDSINNYIKYKSESCSTKM